MDMIGKYAPGKGTTMGEVEALARFIELMKQAEDCCRAIGQFRSDVRWLTVGKLINQVHDKAIGLANSRMTMSSH